MPTNGEGRPPERSGQPDSSDQPDYTVYGRGGQKRKANPPKDSNQGEEKPEATAGKQEPEPEQKPGPEQKPEPEERPKPPGKPEYTVYRSRPSLRERFRKPDMASLRRERRGPGGGYIDRLRAALGGGGGRRWLRWILIALGAWLLISFISFAISAQIQKGELADSAKDELSPASPLL